MNQATEIVNVELHHFQKRETSVHATPLALAVEEHFGLPKGAVSDPGDGRVLVRFEGEKLEYQTDLPFGHNLRRQYGGFTVQPCAVELIEPAA